MSFLKIRQVADLFGVHENTIRNWCDEGLLPFEEYGARAYRHFDAATIGDVLRAEGEFRRRQNAPPAAANPTAPDVVD